MKKSKLSLGLVTSFIGALALTSCGTSTASVTSSKKSIVDFIGYNTKDEKLEINIDKFYSEYGESDNATTLFYNAVLEALIRYEYEDLSKDTSGKYKEKLKSYDTLLSEADKKVETQVQVAKDNAKSNGTTFAKEWDKILESYDCEKKSDLKEHFLYELEKEAIQDWYFRENQSTLKDEYIGVDKDWKVVESDKSESVFPYHILHVLVKLGADATDYSRATITADEAGKLWSVVRKLMDHNYTFENVAYSDSDDTSNKSYGDVGIMSTQTSFYNEFKLGIYAYDAILSGVNTETADNKAIYDAFGVSSTSEVVTEKLSTEATIEVKEKVTDLIDEQMIEGVSNAITGYNADKTAYTAIPTIPYDVFRKIGAVKDEEKVANEEPEAGAVAYPRNVLFNQFLNFRSPFVITAEDVAYGAEDKVTVSAHDFATSADFKLKSHNFVEDVVPSLAGKSVLTDGECNVIIGVRSTAGIHFMVMRKSIFKGTNDSVTAKANTTLQDYYTTEVPSSEKYPVDAYETYVNLTKSDDPNYYTERANTIKNKLKGQDSGDVFDAAYDYRIYQMLLDDVIGSDKVVFFDEKDGKSVVATNIANKIKLLREAKAMSNFDSINGSWKDYLAQLRHQNEIRSYKGMLKTSCVFKFTDGQADAFKKDGECYVK